MKINQLFTLLLTATLVQAVAREGIRTGEEAGIPDRADVKKSMKEEDKKIEKAEEGREVRENQEETDPVFYDSTTSPEEMNGSGTL
ncbi:MAG: hypothetical protein V4598_09260 [Bdellovibrionota bacterium]